VTIAIPLAAACGGRFDSSGLAGLADRPPRRQPYGGPWPGKGDPASEPNRLLAAIPEKEYQSLAPHLEVVDVKTRKVLAWPTEPIRYVYFPRDSVVALLVPMENGSAVEGACVGNEGMIGLEVFLGGVTANQEVVLVIPGEVVRMRAYAFREALQRSPTLRRVLNRFTLVLMNQMARISGCHRAHPVHQRCARWLLMCHDRLGGRDTFAATHELIGDVLGVRRASITEAARALHQAGAIAYRRGQMTILDRAALERATCEDYRRCRDCYDELI
jgi:CRP-like cAMP-binding protein